MRIKIIDVPPGCDDEDIRRSLVGMEIRAITREDVAAMPKGSWIGPASDDIHFRVSLLDLVEQLKAAGKATDARYWEVSYKATARTYLALRRTACEIIEK